MKIDIETLKKTKGIGSKTLERIIEQHEIDNNIKSFESTYMPSKLFNVDKDITLWQGDCLQLMSHIPDKSVDMILCDLPYGTTACSWDEVIPFEPLWKHYKRIIKDNGAIVLFGSEPFSTKLRMSNLDWYKYDWVWKKEKGLGFLNAKLKPLQDYETVSVFSNVTINKMNYFPQMREGKPYVVKNKPHLQKGTNGGYKAVTTVNSGERYPLTIIEYNRVRNTSHPTQKPVDLLEYLIKTYTNEGMTVLDNTMGSGSTGVACKNTNRKFIGIELDEEYFNIAKERINED
mgnify:FL=1